LHQKEAKLQSMKALKVLDLLRHRLILLSTPKEEEFLPKERILIHKSGEHLVAKVLTILPNKIEEKDKEEPWTFEKKLNEKENQQYEKIQKDEKTRIIKAQKMADKLKLEMRIFASRIGWKERIVSFFFTCDEAVDFRELLKLMGADFKCRIHLERVGSRDKARIVGGFGVCGRETCCSSYKNRLISVPMDAVRDQGIMIKENNKLLGLCSKLKCCFLYELPLYREKRKSLPHIRQTIMTKNNQKGRVIGLDILNQKVKVLLLDPEVIETFDVEEINTQ